MNIIDRGGLWKVNENVISVFEMAECHFRIATQKHVSKIEMLWLMLWMLLWMILNVMVDATDLHHPAVLKSKSEEVIKK